MARRCLPALLLAALAAACSGGAGDDGAPAGPANVVLIVVDDAGWADWGDPRIPTPHLDGLARDGVRFATAYATASVCSPSRAALLTGRYPQRFGHEFNLPNKVSNKAGLPAGERTLADHLRAAGYRTFAVGKWHLGYTEPFHPRTRGFDHFFGFLRGARSYLPLPEERQKRLARLQRDGQDVSEDFGYLTERFGAEAVAVVEDRGAGPFFLYLAFSALHVPLEADPAVLAEVEGFEGERRTYAAMMVSLDRAVGRVLAALDDAGLARDTLVVVVNDNGGSEANAADNAPLRGGKGTPFEGGLRVPMVGRWPARWPAGATFEEPVSLLDVVPTSLAAAGVAAPEGLDGVDLTPFVTGVATGAPHGALFWRRGADWAVRRESWKLVAQAGGEPALFDLASDPGETRDRAAEEPEHVRELRDAHAAWAAGLAEPRWRTFVGDVDDEEGDDG